MKLITLLLLCLPLFVSAADHGGAAAESKEPATAPVEAAEEASTPAAADEHDHGGEPAEEKK